MQQSLQETSHHNNFSNQDNATITPEYFSLEACRRQRKQQEWNLSAQLPLPASVADAQCLSSVTTLQSRMGQVMVVYVVKAAFEQAPGQVRAQPVGSHRALGVTYATVRPS